MEYYILPEPSKYLPMYKKRGIKFGGWISVNSKIVVKLQATKNQILVNSRVGEPTRYYRIKGKFKRKYKRRK